MKLLILTISTFFALVIGYAIGATPIINTFLSLNILFIIPVGGFLLGMVISYPVSILFLKSNLLVRGRDAIFVGMISCLAYLAADFSAYRNLKINFEDKKYSISELISFPEYMQYRLDKSSYKFSRSDTEIKVSSNTTKIFYGLHLFGAFLSCLILLGLMSEKTFCSRCSKYYNPFKKQSFLFNNKENFLMFYDEMVKNIKNNAFNYFVSTLSQTATKSSDKDFLKLEVALENCKGCDNKLVRLKAFNYKNDEWKEVLLDWMFVF